MKIKKHQYIRKTYYLNLIFVSFLTFAPEKNIVYMIIQLYKKQYVQLNYRS